MAVTIILGHRGASADAPENSLAAFALARRQGADGIELDVRCTADGVVVVHHDATWGRSPAAVGLREGEAVAATDAADRPDGVPLLTEVLELAGRWPGAVLNVELKHEDGHGAAPGRSLRRDAPGADPIGELVGAVRRSLTGSAVVAQVLLSSFDAAVVAEAVRTMPAVPVGRLLAAPAAATVELAALAGAGCASVHPGAAAVDEAFVRRAHAAGLAVHAWTVDDPAEVVRLARLGVDGVITNVPAVAVAALRDAGLRPG